MNKKPTNNKDFIKNVLLWALLFFGVFAIINSFQKKNEPVVTESTVTIQSIANSYTIGSLAEFKIENNSAESLSFADTCTDTKIFRLANDKRIEVSKPSLCTEPAPLTVAANKTAQYNVSAQNTDSFSEAGEYFVSITDQNGNTYESKKFEIDEAGFFTRMFRTFISKPMFNALVFLTQNLPGKPFGIAIILLTLIVRSLLFYPNQKAMRSQRAMQKLQPKLDEVKKKFKGNQQMIAMKTMELYKTHKVNPMSSCLPMLIQIPVMLGVYYSVKDGMEPHLSHLLYDFQANADLASVNTQFLWWDLSNIPWNTFIASISFGTAIYLAFPLLVAGAQYIAISLTMNNKKKQQPKKKTKKESDKPGMAEQMEAMTGMMKYAMPVMIGFFAATFPAALGLYWLTSTIFGIFQQKLVNKQLDEKPEIRKKIA